MERKISNIQLLIAVSLSPFPCILSDHMSRQQEIFFPVVESNGKKRLMGRKQKPEQNAVPNLHFRNCSVPL